MDDSKWERWGALGGILFVILVLASAFLPGSPPKTSDPTSDMAKFILDKSDEIRIAGYLGAVAAVPFFWFLASLWRLLRRGEGGTPRLTVMAALGGGFAAVVGAIGGIVLAVLPLVRSSLTAGLLRTLYILATSLAFTALFGIAAFVLSRVGGVPPESGHADMARRPRRRGRRRRVDRRRRDRVDQRHALHVRVHRLRPRNALDPDREHHDAEQGTGGLARRNVVDA